jgi:hypothetical protein
MQKNPYLECLLKDLDLSLLLIQFVGHLRPHRVNLADELNKTFLRTGHCSARDWDDKDYLRIIPRVVW